MRELILGCLAVAGVGGGVFYGPDLFKGDGRNSDGSYAMSEAEAISRMMAAQAPAGKPPFFDIAVEANNIGDGVVEWAGAGSHAAIKCQAKVAVVSETSVKVTPSCLGGGPSDGAAAGMTGDMINLGFAEFVAAGLEQRPMDMRKWAAQSMGAVFKGLPAAKNQALQMDAEARAARASQDPADFELPEELDQSHLETYSETE